MSRVAEAKLASWKIAALIIVLGAPAWAVEVKPDVRKFETGIESRVQEAVESILEDGTQPIVTVRAQAAAAPTFNIQFEALAVDVTIPAEKGKADPALNQKISELVNKMLEGMNPKVTVSNIERAAARAEPAPAADPYKSLTMLALVVAALLLAGAAVWFARSLAAMSRSLNNEIRQLKTKAEPLIVSRASHDDVFNSMVRQADNDRLATLILTLPQEQSDRVRMLIPEGEARAAVFGKVKEGLAKGAPK